MNTIMDKVIKNKSVGQKCEAIVVGVSAGGLDALNTVIPCLPGDLHVPVFVVQHQLVDAGEYLPKSLDEQSRLTVKQADDGERIEKGVVYLAAPNYHLMIEQDRSLSLSTDEKVSYARPSIDVLFETAAEAYGEGLLAVVLTGANADGSQGVKKVKDFGGRVVVQNPETAFMKTMPQAAMDMVEVDFIVDLDDISRLLSQLCGV